MPSKIVRAARFCLKPALPAIKKRVLRIRSTPARGLIGHAGQWSLPSRADKEEQLLRSLNYNGKTVYDIGANIGATTLFFSDQVGSGGAVVAFEPNPEAFSLLKRHVELNRLENVIMEPFAVGIESKRTTLRVPRRASGAGSLRPTISDTDLVEYEIDQIALDQFIEDKSLPAPSFVKIDTEGFESECLRGMQRIIHDHHPTILLEVHGYSEEEKLANSKEIVQILNDEKYDLFHVETNRRINASNCYVAKRGHLFATIDPDAVGHF